jgi:hypothetical protein
MTAMELEACKQELIKEINAADSFDEIRCIAQKLSRSLRPEAVMKVEEDMTPYTRREINSMIDKSLSSKSIPQEEMVNELDDFANSL